MIFRQLIGAWSAFEFDDNRFGAKKKTVAKGNIGKTRNFSLEGLVPGEKQGKTVKLPNYTLPKRALTRTTGDIRCLTNSWICSLSRGSQSQALLIHSRQGYSTRPSKPTS